MGVHGEAKTDTNGEHPPPNEAGMEHADAGTSQHRRCAYSRCRAVLPEARTGRKREFCHERDRTWTVDERQVTCAELGRAERLLAAAHGDGDSTAAGLDVTVLGEHVGTALDGLQRLQPTFSTLVDTLGGVRDQLHDDVATARAARAAAESDAADARGRADAAEAARLSAEQDRQTAEQARAEAETAQQAAEEATREAQTARARAEGQRDQHAAQVAELEQRLAAVTARRDEAEQTLAATRSELDGVRQTLADTHQRLTEATDRANRLVGEHTEALDKLHRDHAAELDRLRGEHAGEIRRLEQEHARALETTRDEASRAAESDKDALRDQHAAQVAELHQQLGSLRGRAETAEQARQHAVAQLRHRRNQLLELLDSDTEPDRDQLRGHLRALAEQQNLDE